MALSLRASRGGHCKTWCRDERGHAVDCSTTLICHLVEHRPLAFYAERLGISPTHLNRLARLHFGETVRALIDRKLIAAARHELVFSRFPAQLIAFSLGFSDPGYFNRFFRKKTGMTPGRYRVTQRGRA